MTLTPPTSDDAGSSALTWVTFTAGGWYTNGAADLGAPNGPCAAAIDPSGDRVWLRGVMNPGASGLVALLPAEYRPSAQRLLLAFADGAAQGLDIRTTGIMDAFSTPSGSLSLDGLFYSL